MCKEPGFFSRIEFQGRVTASRTVGSSHTDSYVRRDYAGDKGVQFTRSVPKRDGKTAKDKNRGR